MLSGKSCSEEIRESEVRLLKRGSIYRWSSWKFAKNKLSGKYWTYLRPPQFREPIALITFILNIIKPVRVSTLMERELVQP
jgi:hypothetical protein